MSDKVLIGRELLERLADIAEIEGQPEGAQARALLTAQPQDSALAEAAPGCFVQPVPSHCDRITWRGSYYHLPDGLTQASAGNSSYLCHHCNTPLMMHGQQIYCPKCSRKQSQASAAQPAPVVPDGYAIVPVEPTPEMLDVAVSHALMVSLSGDYNWSAYMRDVWLRMISAAAPAPAQTAPVVPERMELAPYQTVDRGSTNYKAGWNACRKAMLEAIAAAPAQGQQVGREPVLFVDPEALPSDDNSVRAYRRKSEVNSQPLYTTPQPAPAQDVEGLVEALADAAQSLETISNGAGRDEFMSDFSDVRGYARSRASVARAALAANDKQSGGEV